MRKQLANAVSKRALDEQVPPIQSHIDTLVAQFQTLANSGEPPNIADWLNFTSFEIIGHLADGESFHCFEEGQYHPYAAFVLEAFKGGLFASACNRYGLLKFAARLMPKEMARKRVEFLAMALELTRKRIAQKESGHGFFSYMLSVDKSERVMTHGKMVTNAAIFILAGSESTVMLLSGTSLFLLRDAERMAKVTKEVRDAFEAEDQINVPSAAKLPFMHACLEESMRMVSPAPFGLGGGRQQSQP
jgi:cytochrome P450